MLIKQQYKGYRTHRNRMKVATHLEPGDLVLVSPPSSTGIEIEFVGRFIGTDGSGCPAFLVKHNGKQRRVWGWECWWIRKDEAERLRKLVVAKKAKEKVQ